MSAGGRQGQKGWANACSEAYCWLIHVVKSHKSARSVLVVLLLKGLKSSLVGILPYIDGHGSPLHIIAGSYAECNEGN